MLAYTLSRLMTEQAVIQRNMSQADAYGADGPENWQPLSTIPCRLWWDKSTGGARSANRVYVDPARAVPIDQGGLLVALGTDVTENDRITQVLARNPVSGTWTTYLEGLFTIVAVLVQEDHMEINLTRAHLGA
jgi:hypothetical protein